MRSETVIGASFTSKFTKKSLFGQVYEMGEYFICLISYVVLTLHYCFISQIFLSVETKTDLKPH